MSRASRWMPTKACCCSPNLIRRLPAAPSAKWSAPPTRGWGDHGGLRRRPCRRHSGGRAVPAFGRALGGRRRSAAAGGARRRLPVGTIHESCGRAGGHRRHSSRTARWLRLGAGLGRRHSSQRSLWPAGTLRRARSLGGHRRPAGLCCAAVVGRCGTASSTLRATALMMSLLEELWLSVLHHLSVGSVAKGSKAGTSSGAKCRRLRVRIVPLPRARSASCLMRRATFTSTGMIRAL